MSIENEHSTKTTTDIESTQENQGVQVDYPGQDRHVLPKNESRHRPSQGRYKRMLKTVDKLLNKNVHRRCNKDKHSHIGKKSQHNRRVIVNTAMRRLHELGYHIEDIYHLTIKHEIALKKDWITRDQNPLAPGTYQLYVSVMHQVGIWIKKPWLFKDPKAHLPDGVSIARSYVADREKFQTGVGKADIQQMLREATDLDERFGCLLTLIACFGLRSEEALLFHPHTALQNGVIQLKYGTKGGKHRELHETVSLRRTEVLRWAQRLVPTEYESMIPAQFDYKRFHNRYRTLCRKFGLTKTGRWGFTPHALRQLKFVEIYEAVAGGLPPVAGGTASDVTRERDIAARKAIAAYGGHGETRVGTGYVGAIVTKPGGSRAQPSSS